MSDLVSVIIPVYNMASSLKNAVKSILIQDYKNIEVILIDDGSVDNSLQICKEISSMDNRVKVIHTNNQGSGPARNIGIKASNGKFLYFPDADDLLDPKAITILVDIMNNENCDLIVFGYRCKSHQGKLIYEKKYTPLIIDSASVRENYSNYFDMSYEYGIQGAPWNKFFRGNIIRKFNIEFPPLRRHQDEAFISRYVSHCKNNIIFISDVLYTYLRNSIELEWNKFPIDYINSVIGLRDIWKVTICSWNPNDKFTHKLVKQSIFSRIVKALELSYSPKNNLNVFSRPKWIKLICEKADIYKYDLTIARSFYQKIILLLSKLHLYFLISIVVYVGNIKKMIKQKYINRVN